MSDNLGMNQPETVVKRRFHAVNAVCTNTRTVP